MLCSCSVLIECVNFWSFRWKLTEVIMPLLLYSTVDLSITNKAKGISCSEKSYMALSKRIAWLWIRGPASNCTATGDHQSYMSLSDLSTALTDRYVQIQPVFTLVLPLSSCCLSRHHVHCKILCVLLSGSHCIPSGQFHVTDKVCQTGKLTEGKKFNHHCWQMHKLPPEKKRKRSIFSSSNLA